MAHLQYVVACVFVLVLCVQQGYSLECYVCNSHNDSACMLKEPPIHYKQVCKLEPYDTKGDPHRVNATVLCRKIKQMIDFEVNGLQPETRIIRGCGWYNSSLANHCYQRSGFGGRQEVCACTDKNLCNTSTNLVATSPLMLLAVFYTILNISH